MKNAVFILSMLLLLGACKEEPAKPAEEGFNGIRYTATGSLGINVVHKFNTADLKQNTDYVTAAGDTISIEQLRYYFSNVQLKNADGIWVNLGNYNLLDIEDAASMKVAITNVPAGTYNKIRFYIGVDSVANSSGAQEGALNPANDMFWSWNTGYIFFRLKGKFNGNNPLALDIGGIANLPVIEADLASFKQKSNAITINTEFNLADVFTTPTNYNLRTMPSMIHSASSEGAPVLRDNIQSGVFVITSVQ
ncbi:MAG: MbnP family protein [Bacteroidota bacterium]